MTDEPNIESTQPNPPVPRKSGGSGLIIPLIIVFVVLGIIGTVAVVAAVFASRNSLEQAAIAATVQAFATSTNTPVPTVEAPPPTDPLPTDSQVASLDPTTEPETEPEAEVTEAPATSAPQLATPVPAATQPPAPTAVVSQPTAAAPAPTALPPTPTVPAPTATNPPPAASGQVTGTLQMCNNKPSYAANIENICVIETINNPGTTQITYGILGIQATNLSGGPSKFHTSWQGELAIDPGCTGPVDRCGGPHQDNLRLEAGTYQLTMVICYSDINTCTGGSGNWQVLTPPIQVEVIVWIPTATP